MKYKISSDWDYFNDKPLYRVLGVDNEYVGEWGSNLSCVEKELSDLSPQLHFMIKKSNRIFMDRIKTINGTIQVIGVILFLWCLIYFIKGVWVNSLWLVFCGFSSLYGSAIGLAIVDVISRTRSNR